MDYNMNNACVNFTLTFIAVTLVKYFSYFYASNELWKFFSSVKVGVMKDF